MKQKLLAIFLVMVMLMVIGCQSTTTPEETTANTENPVETPQATAPTNPAETQEIVVWTVWTGAGGDCLQSIADKFNAAQSDYKVNMTFSGSYPETLAKYQATAAGNRPDAVMVSTEYVAFFADNPEYFTPVQKYVSEDSYDLSDIFPNLLNSYSDIDGNLLCVPLGNTVVGFFYNTKVLQDAGIDPLTELNSYDEIAEACDKLQANGVQYPFLIAPNSIYYTFPITAEGLDYVDNENGKADLCTRSLIAEEPLASITTKFFKFIQDRQIKGQLAPIDTTAADARQMFVDGKVAIYMSTISGLTGIGDLCNWQVEFGFHASPTVSKGAENKGQCTGGGALFLANNNNAVNERGAWEFMKFLMQPENTAAFAMATGYLPTTMSGYNTAEYQEFVNTKFPTAVYAMEAQQATSTDCYNALLPMFGDFHQIVIDYTNKVISDLSYTPEQATKDLAAAVDECIELYTMSK
jgi:sn-glycerol 3-phosphate transport system substrate-binding protein